MDLPIPFSLALAVALLVFTVIYSGRWRGPTKGTKPRDQASSSLFQLVKNSHRILDWTTELLTASPTHTVTTFMGVVTADPANVEHILKTRFDNYPKGDRSTTILADFLGSGIFNSDGDHWKLQRKTASLEFSTKTIRTFVLANVRLAVAGGLLPRLARASSTGETLDLQDLLERLAFDNVCKVAFGVDPALLVGGGDAGGGAEFAHAFEEASGLCVRRFRDPFLFVWKLKRLLNIGSERLLKEKIATVHDYAMRVVRSRKQAGEAGLGDDLLSRFIVEEDYDDGLLRDIIISFVLAGRDTTSATLTWFFWLISTRPAVKERVLGEIRRVRSKSTSQAELFTLEEVREMDYLHAALSETLRLYPPVPLQTRECAAEDELPDGTAVGRGQMVMYSSYAMGRMESIWGKDCRVYRPERWLDQNGVFQPKSPFKFPVFHAGPRMCLGKDMAYIQMKAVAASVMERFEIEVLDKEREREPDFTMILRVKGGLPVLVREKLGEGATVAS